MGIGGIWIPADKRPEFKNGINEIKKKHNARGELKWKKVSPAKIDFYKEIIEYFCGNEFIRFRIILLESQKIDKVKFHKNDGELSFYKFYYQLLQHWILDYNEYDIFLDSKINKDRYRLKTLNEVLSNANLSSIINRVQALPSEQSCGIQLADFLTGLVMSKFNNETVGTSKKQLLEFLELKSRKKIEKTTKHEEKLNIFMINLQGGW